MLIWVVVVATIVGVNLMPVLGPPTWAVLVLFRLNYHLPLVPLVLAGACSSAAGRYALALGTRKAARWLPAERVARLQSTGELLRQRRTGALAGLALFLLSPLPSAQLFEAAGVMRVPLRPLTAAFLAGRLVTYTGYVGAAGAAERRFGHVLTKSLTSWPSLVLQVGMLLVVWELSRFDLAGHLRRRAAARAAVGPLVPPRRVLWHRRPKGPRPTMHE